MRHHLFNTLLVLLCIQFSGILHAQQPDTLELEFHWKSDSLQGSSAYDNTYNEVWGFVQNGEEFAIIGSTAGTHIFPLDELHGNKDPLFISSPSSGPHVIHRDYHDFKGYLYAVCDEGANSTLQIIDIRDIRNGVQVVYDSQELFSRAHNIFIDSATAKLYICSHKASSHSPMAIYDISDPVAPSLLGTYSGFGDGNISHVHDAYVKNDTAFLNCGFDGLRVVDFSDPANPDLLATLTEYPFNGYNHSGWATPDMDYYYMGDETHGYDMKVIDITSIHELEVVNTFNAGNPSEFSIPHNQIVHCNRLYVSYYFDGFQLYDISQPEAPERTHVYPTSTEPFIRNYKGNWGVYPFLPSNRILLSDMQEGLFVLKGPECETNTSSTRENKMRSVIYPNPSKGILYFHSDQSIMKHDFVLMNMNGQAIYQTTIQHHDQIHLPSHIPNGTYIVQIQSQKNFEYHRLVLVR